MQGQIVQSDKDIQIDYKKYEKHAKTYPIVSIQTSFS